jgi:hypothetical protein
MNDNLILVCGASTTGKTASLMNLKDPEGVVYLNCEAGKKTPFKNEFSPHTITDPYQVFEAFEHFQGKPDCHTIVIDSISYLLEMFESVHVVNSSNTMKGWSDLAQYFKKLMQHYVANSDKNIIMTAHTLGIMNENEMIIEVKVPVKGSLKNVGLESYFSTVVATKKVPLKVLDNYKNSLLNITEEDKNLQYKYVYQTKLTKDTVNERIRNPLGMFSIQETYMDNDAQLLLNKLHSYYN